MTKEIEILSREQAEEAMMRCMKVTHLSWMKECWVTSDPHYDYITDGVGIQQRPHVFWEIYAHETGWHLWQSPEHSADYIRGWNAAMDLAAQEARTRTNDESTSIIVDKDSITKHKIQP